MVESGIGLPIIHDKYSYCHGRSTLATTNNNIAIYFNLNTELDKLLINELPKYFNTNFLNNQVVMYKNRVICVNYSIKLLYSNNCTS